MKRNKEMEGFSFVMGLIDTVSPYGNQQKRSLQPYKEKEALSIELKKTKVFSEKIVKYKDSYDELRHYLSELKDIKAVVESSMKKQVLSVVDLFELKYFLIRMHKIEKLWRIFGEEDLVFYVLPELTKLLDPKGEELSTFYIYEEYDEELQELREERKYLERRIREKRSEEDKNILLLERRKILAKEEEAEYRVRKDLSEAISGYGVELLHNMSEIGRMDLLLAKAKVAKEYGCAVPILIEEGPLVLEEAWHPYFQHLLEKRSKKQTRISIELKPGSTALTGANMGGKSVALKTIHLNVFLVQCGILPFAKSMTCPFLDEVHLLHEDQEEVRQGLSSFGGEVLKIREILDNLGERPSLILLDEPARGTNPLEGTAIVGGLLNYFKGTGHFLMVATHYDLHHLSGIERYQVRGLKELTLERNESSQISDSRVLVDRLQENMDYSLEKWDGSPTTGDAVKIAEYLGFREELTKEIRKLLE